MIMNNCWQIFAKIDPLASVMRIQNSLYLPEATDPLPPLIPASNEPVCLPSGFRWQGSNYVSGVPVAVNLEAVLEHDAHDSGYH